MDIDQRALDQSDQWGRILAIMHFVLGGFVTLLSCLPGLYIAIGAMMASGAFPTNPNEPSPEFLGAFLAMFGALFMFIILAIGIGNLVAGVMITKRKSWVGVLIVSCINMLNQPLGMLLGIFTLMWLMRADVRESFAAESEDDLDDY